MAKANAVSKWPVPDEWAPQTPAIKPLPRRQSGQVDIAEYLLADGRVPWLGKASSARDRSFYSKAAHPKKLHRHLPTPGVQNLMDPKYYGNEEFVAHHAYQVNPKNVFPSQFAPERHTIMVDGRPMQASCVS